MDVGSAAVVSSIKRRRVAHRPSSVRVLRHRTLYPSLLRKTCAAPLTDCSVVVRLAASFGFSGDRSPDKAQIGRSRVGATRFFNP